MEEFGDQIQKRQRTFAIAWESDDDKPIEFANHLIVTNDGSTYTLRFYQVVPPIPGSELIPDGDEVVKGRHVISLAISEGNMPEIAGILQRMVSDNSNDDEA